MRTKMGKDEKERRRRKGVAGASARKAIIHNKSNLDK